MTEQESKQSNALIVARRHIKATGATFTTYEQVFEWLEGLGYEWDSNNRTWEKVR